MLQSKLRIGMATVVLLVLLRLSLGCHFLYEGVWKIKHPEFSAEGFLIQAKGPAAPLFHAMMPDLDGRDRLKIEPLISTKATRDAWRKVRDDSEKRYRGRLAKPYEPELKELTAKLRELAAPGNPLDGPSRQAEEEKITERIEKIQEEIKEKTDPLVDQLHNTIQPVLWPHEDKLETFLHQNEEAMLAFFAARKKQPSAKMDSESTESVKAWLSAIEQLQKDCLKDIQASVKQDEDAKKAVAETVSKVKAVFDPSTPLDKIVAGNKLRIPKGPTIPKEREVLRLTNAIRADKFYQPFNELKQRVIRKYEFDDLQRAEAELIYRRYKEAIQAVLAENQEDIAVYFAALERLEDREAAGNAGAAHQKQRLYDARRKLRSEVGVWLSGLKAAQRGYQDALAGLPTEQQSRQGSLPVSWTRTDWINFAVTYGLTAIGLCLVLGLLTRPAAVAGGCFMISVVLTQPAWPTIYPPDPAVVGHALLINKDFIEMVALFMLATTAAGRWGGLDHFVGGAIDRLRGSRKAKDNQ